MVMNGIYTHRAAIFEFDRNGTHVKIPEELKGKTRGHLISTDHQYIVVVYGLHRNGDCSIVSMASGDNIKALTGMVEWVPLTVIVPTGRVVGKLSARHSTWFIQSSPNHTRGVVSPSKSIWTTSSAGRDIDRAREELNKKRYKQMMFGRIKRKPMRLFRIKTTNKFYTAHWDDRKAWTY